MFDRGNMNWGVQTLANNFQKGRITFNIPVQRTDAAWDNLDRSKLIRSIIIDLPSGPLNFVRRMNGNNAFYEGVDGQQRTTAITMFLNNGFRLHRNTKNIIDRDGNPFKIAGYKFSGLPEWIQERIRDYNVTIYYYNGGVITSNGVVVGDGGITDDEIIELVDGINAGKAWNAAEKRRLNTKSLSAFQEIAKHPVVVEAATKSWKRGFVDEQIGLHLWIMMNEESPSLTASKLTAISNNAYVTEEQKNEILLALDLVSGLFAGIDGNLTRKLSGRTNFVSIAYMGYLANKNNISQNEYNEKVLAFFASNDGASISPIYNMTIIQGSSKQASLQARMGEMQKHMLGKEQGQQSLI